MRSRSGKVVHHRCFSRSSWYNNIYGNIRLLEFDCMSGIHCLKPSYVGSIVIETTMQHGEHGGNPIPAPLFHSGDVSATTLPGIGYIILYEAAPYSR